ncbi:hypothetical protein DIPPA_51776 [Diplonema papillatum]|nr:hypothetical protein DIPPA_27066 [Diplonema papillatum]KAJ9466618.1 hypothetical protein DIPPA_51776 [Diplonema papillatum]
MLSTMAELRPIEPKSVPNGTPLMHASANGHEAVVRLLVAAGAVVDATDDRAYPCLRQRPRRHHKGADRGGRNAEEVLMLASHTRGRQCSV